MSKEVIGTFIGCVAIALWSINATMLTELNNLPTFKLLAIVLSLAFVTTCVLITIRGHWNSFKMPAYLWLLGSLSMIMNQWGFLVSLKTVPPAQAILIHYLWPLFVVVCSGFLSKETVSLPSIAGALLSFIGVFYLITDGNGVDTISIEYIRGYFLAFFSGIIWAGYTLFSRVNKTTVSSYTLGLCSGSTAVFCFVCHLAFEASEPIVASQIPYLVVIGFGVMGISFFSWDFGVKNGNVSLLGVLSFFTPVLSVFVLIVFGKAESKTTLYIAALCVAFGSLLPNISQQFKAKRFRLENG